MAYAEYGARDGFVVVNAHGGSGLPPRCRSGGAPSPAKPVSG